MRIEIQPKTVYCPPRKGKLTAAEIAEKKETTRYMNELFFPGVEDTMRAALRDKDNPVPEEEILEVFYD